VINDGKRPSLIVDFCCINSARIIVDASIELMRAESFSNESSQVNLSENSRFEIEIETDRGRNVSSRDRDETEIIWT